MVDFACSNRKYWHGSVASYPPKVNGERWSTPGWVLSIPLEDEQASAHLSPKGGQKGEARCCLCSHGIWDEANLEALLPALGGLGLGPVLGVYLIGNMQASKSELTKGLSLKCINLKCI